MIPQDDIIGDDKALILGKFALRNDLQLDFKQYLLDTGYASDQSRANTVWTQAREYFYSDTGTVTARPHWTPVQAFTAQRAQTYGGRLPIFTSQKKIDEWNNQIFPNQLQIRFSSGSLDLEDSIYYVVDGGLFGLSVIGLHGEYSYTYVLINS